jgi:hypothetical protein
MAILLASEVTITAPAASDGFGEAAVLNNSASGNFVGTLHKVSGFGGPGVRQSTDDIPEGHGAVFGDFFHGHRPFTMEVQLYRGANYAASDARYNKLCRAWNAMADDGSIVWTDTDSIAKRILFRREQAPSDPDEQGHVLLGGMAASPRIEANTATTGTSPSTNAGNVGAPPTFTFTPSGNGTVILTNTTISGSPAVTINVGATGVATGSAVTVDFGARTVTQGGTRKDNAVEFPSSTWWEVIPGSNTWTRTGTATISVAAAISFRSAWLSA